MRRGSSHHNNNPLFFFSCLLLLLVVFAQQQELPRYTLSNLQTTANGYVGDLTLTSGSGPFGLDIPTLRLQVYQETKSRLRIKIIDPTHQRWEVPNVVQTTTPDASPSDLNYKIDFQESPFRFTVTRKEDQQVLFDSTEMFVFSDAYITIGTALPANPNIYGIGERCRELKLEMNQNYTMFNKDTINTYHKNLYGTHPFYMDVRSNGKAHGVFLLNSNGMEVELSDKDEKNSFLQYRTIGGVIDLFMFTGTTPDAVIKQYQEVIGKPYFPPRYALGWHQCRWGYSSIQDTKAVVQKYKEKGIPLEVMWNDIDYMNEKMAFTTDPVNYPVDQVKQFVKELNDNNQHYIIILDPGMRNETGYEPYELGLQMDVFIKKADGVTPIVNKVWPGYTVFPDFTNPKTQEYWSHFISKFHADVGFSGLWIDMNEIATFCFGECDSYSDSGVKKIGNFDLNNPPFVPGGEPLNDKTLRMDSVQHATSYYNAHNLYGITSSDATRVAMEALKPGERVFVLSRSTYAGSGHRNAHWTGDNWSNYEMLRWSITGLINMNMFGIPMIGSDICGFLNDTNYELCMRWTQVGAYYPFSRNHNDIKSISQEPYVYDDTFVQVTKTAILNKYSLLPYYYTLFYKAHVNGGTVMRALFWNFPEQVAIDPTITSIDQQFMIGDALMVSPVLAPGVSSVKAYFPAGVWYDYYTAAQFDYSKNAQTVSLDAPLGGNIPVHVLGGNVIPKQRPGMTTKETSQNPFELVVALDSVGQATGDLYIDDGSSKLDTKQYTLVSYFANILPLPDSNTPPDGVLMAKVLAVNDVSKDLFVDTIQVWGIAMKVCEVRVDGQNTAFHFDAAQKTMAVSTKLPVNKAFEMRWVQCQEGLNGTAVALIVIFSLLAVAAIVLLAITVALYVAKAMRRRKADLDEETNLINAEKDHLHQ